jgi:hypothetical protein
VAGNWAGRIGAVTGICALIISAGSAYVTTFRQVDDLRVLIGHPPIPAIEKTGDLLIIGSLNLTFINSGNRSVAISGVQGLVTRLSVAHSTSTECRTKDTYGVPFKIDTFILKAGEIVERNVDIDAWFVWEKRPDVFGMTARAISKSRFEAKPNDVFLTCLALKIVTPDSYSSEISKPAFRYELADGGSIPLFEPDSPIIFLQRTRMVFSNITLWSSSRSTAP